jgi:hypothetical protein
MRMPYTVINVNPNIAKTFLYKTNILLYVYIKLLMHVDCLKG